MLLATRQSHKRDAIEAAKYVRWRNVCIVIHGFQCFFEFAQENPLLLVTLTRRVSV